VDQGLLTIEDSQSHSKHNTLDWTPLDERSALQKDLYLTPHNTHKNQTSNAPDRIRSRTPITRPQTHAIDRVATGIGD
jgi:hypothetical protein